jgi:GAF domain-containing protein
MITLWCCSISLESNSQSAAAALLQRRMYEHLVDFDNHLDDLSQDWRNLNLNQEVEEKVGTVG